MNNKHVRTAVLNTILEKGVIDNANVLGTLTDKAKIGGISGRDKVLGALDTLERNGAIGVTRRGKQIVKVFPITKEACERSDRADRSPAAKRESMFAKGTPAYLTDRMCTPVVVIKKEDRELATPNDMPAKIQSTNETNEKLTTDAQPVELTTSTKHTLLEEVNLAYTGLRCRADQETGVLPVGSVHAFILEDLKCSRSRATTLNQTLAKLGLRMTTNLGFIAEDESGRRVVQHQSTVDVTVDLITQEMLDALSSASKQAVAVNEIQAVTPSDDVVVSPEDVTAKLIEIINGLEADIDQLKRDNQDEVDKNGRLTKDLELERSRNSALKTQLATLQASAVDPGVASILERYNKL